MLKPKILIVSEVQYEAWLKQLGSDEAIRDAVRGEGFGDFYVRRAHLDRRDGT